MQPLTTYRIGYYLKKNRMQVFSTDKVIIVNESQISLKEIAVNTRVIHIMILIKN